MNNSPALYISELEELLLDGGESVKVPHHVAATFSKNVMDIRFVRRWAIRSNLISENAEVCFAV